MWAPRAPGNRLDPTPSESDGSVAARRLRYWQLTRIAYERVHAGCETCTVLAGASAVGDAISETRNDNESAQWLDWAYANGYGGFFDAVAHHPYPAWNMGRGPSRPECATRGPCSGRRTSGAASWRRSARSWSGVAMPPRRGDATKRSGAPSSDIRRRALTDSWQRALAPGCSPHRQSALRSADGRFQLWLQGDGNLVLHQGAAVLWKVTGRNGITLTNRTDGNLVLIDGAGAVVWSSGTAGKGLSDLNPQNDGNLVLYPGVTPTRASWSSGTWGHRAGP